MKAGRRAKMERIGKAKSTPPVEATIFETLRMIKETDFAAKFINVLNNGQKCHTHVITVRPMNNTKVSLAPDRSASLSGTVDVRLNGTSVWTTKVNLMINNGKTLTINLHNQATSNHFQGQSIFGVVDSMKDSTGNGMLKAQQQAVQRTEK